MGCAGTPPPDAPPKPYAGVALRVAAPDAPVLRQLLQRHGNAWRDHSGATVEAVPADDPAADLVVFPSAGLGKAVAAGQLPPLTDSIRNKPGFDFSLILRSYRNHLIDWGGANYALPLLGEGFVCVFRADLLDDPKHRAKIDGPLKRPLPATGPATWQDVEAVANYFRETPEWRGGEPAAAAPRASLPALPDSPEELDRLFHAVAAPFARRAIIEEQFAVLGPDDKKRLLYDYQFDAHTGEPRIADPGFVEALALLQRLAPCRSTQKGERAAEAFAAGRAVLALVSLADLPALQRADEAGRVKLGICPVPGSAAWYDAAGPHPADAAGNAVPYIGAGGWLVALGAKAVHTDAAYDFLTYLTGPDTSLQIVGETDWGGGPTRQTHLDIGSRKIWYNYRLSEKQTDQLVLALERGINPPIVNPAYRLRTPDEHEFMLAETEEVRAALEGKTPAAAALQAVARRWNELIAATGKEKHVQQYRANVGLR